MKGSAIHTMRMLVAAAMVAVAGVTVFTSCEEEKKSYVKNIGDGEHTPTMSTVDVHTFISDSGYTKYYITAPLWNMYDESREPYWLFPSGIELEQYDNKLKPVAHIRCDSAKYLSQRRLWRLDGHVMMVNTQRDSFLTTQLYWDQGRREIYTDSFIHIVRENRIIEGVGFTSNENLTAYTVKRPTGIFPVDRKPGESKGPAAPADSVNTNDTYRGMAPPRASYREQRSYGPRPIEHDSIPRSMQVKP